MNNYVNNNNQDMILREKIEKREKFDTILAYILLVVLLGCVGIVVFLKINDNNKEDKPNVDEYVPTYISLGEISSSLNTSVLANRYMNNGASLGSRVNGNSLVVTYTNEDDSLNLDMPMVGSELMVEVPMDNREVATEIYKEVATIICMYYGNEEKYCRNTLDNMTNDGIDGIRFDVSDDNTTVYINTTKSYAVNNEMIYNAVTRFSVNDSDYVLNLLGIKVYNVNVTTSDVNVIFTGNLDRIDSDDTSNLSVLIKLYDVDGNVLGENKYEYNEENVLEGSGTFEVTFLVSESLRLENINEYSIEIVK